MIAGENSGQENPYRWLPLAPRIEARWAASSTPCRRQRAIRGLQTYKRAHGNDLRTTSAAEAEARQRSEAKQAATADEPKETSMSETVKDMAKDIAEKVSDAFTSTKDGAMAG